MTRGALRVRAVLVTAGVLLCGSALAFQEPAPQPEPPKGPFLMIPGEPRAQARSLEEVVEEAMKAAELSLEVKGVFEIPDPPPHEGAMIVEPYIVEPPDFLFVEVLESLPGRPISGVRLVRPDGTITLGFYGDVYVKGLTLAQVKTKIILHLRKYLNDEVLGLLENDAESEGPMEEEPVKGVEPVPVVPQNGKRSDPGKEGLRDLYQRPLPPEAKAPSESGRRARPTRLRSKAPARRPSARLARRTPKRVILPLGFVPTVFQQSDDNEARTSAPASAPAPPHASAIAIPSSGHVKITIEVMPTPAPQGAPVVINSEEPGDGDGVHIILPAESDRVYVDMDSYNSRYYYVWGDISLPGRYPITGNETVLDALSFAGGLLPTADRNEIYLARPARGKSPERIYKIDYDAIIQKSDKRANLQIFNGDRLVIGRNAVVKSTVELSRQAEVHSLLLNELSRYATTMRGLANINQPYSSSTTVNVFTKAGKEGASTSASSAPPLTPAQREQFLKEWLDLWWKFTPPNEAKLDEQTFRDMFVRPVPGSPRTRPREPAKGKARQNDRE